MASSNKCIELTERVGKGRQDWPPRIAHMEQVLNKLFVGNTAVKESDRVWIVVALQRL